ncbi:uncharacterized protein LOC111251064 isoform X1 [Varroa destructor]|uniref:Uncharacterized protein n=1 Tax=Varroa destructor TaxID=109461 RepID=A0A7M7KAM0_VARDE|nr:uncharacterized protein LOC111251064 isoform X1 [Varroa destructor]XP_022663017.1 uncharacterized protein LOC111251064 isoform X1 [Varroa destructor]XP_022663018.1 uncharacterized protein LOC111251064 isoform X1 [Varroa destructor]XP_022663019.1 uncharacterized protein LOC111251064 isoform X1 [Varroa destructor]XP_022663020.1 uncharacterized protein LOC111251064 isoform X1 [Varroa destructor]XP_022663021.1 uncharacterized protein LOC111251064 isoform X1 [Varroa destructor]XP_022663022.1 un
MLEISKYSTGESIFQFGEVRCIVEVPLSLPVRNANPGPAPVDQWNLPWFNEVFSHCRLQTSVYFKTGVSHDCRSKIFLINKLRTLYPVTCPSCAILLRIKFELQIVPQDLKYQLVCSTWFSQQLYAIKHSAGIIQGPVPQNAKNIVKYVLHVTCCFSCSVKIRLETFETSPFAPITSLHEKRNSLFISSTFYVHFFLRSLFACYQILFELAWPGTQSTHSSSNHLYWMVR